MSFNLAVFDGKRSLRRKRFLRNIWIAIGVAVFICCLIVLFVIGGDSHAGAH